MILKRRIKCTRARSINKRPRQRDTGIPSWCHSVASIGVTFFGEFRDVRSRIRRVFREGRRRSRENGAAVSWRQADKRKRLASYVVRWIAWMRFQSGMCRAYVTLARRAAWMGVWSVSLHADSAGDFTYRRVLPRDFLMQHANRSSVSHRRGQPARRGVCRNLLQTKHTSLVIWSRNDLS